MLSYLVLPLTLILEIHRYDIDFEYLDFVDDIVLIASSIKAKRKKQLHITPPKIFLCYEKKTESN